MQKIKNATASFKDLASQLVKPVKPIVYFEFSFKKLKMKNI